MKFLSSLQCLFVLKLHPTSIPHPSLIRYSHSSFSSSIPTLFFHSITNLRHFSSFAIWVCLKFLLERFNCFSQRKCGSFFMHNHLPELNNNPHFSLTFHTRLSSTNTNGNVRSNNKKYFFLNYLC